jgi:hypothetical protein
VQIVLGIGPPYQRQGAGPAFNLTQLAQLGDGFCDFARHGASRIKGLDGLGG